MGSYICKYFLLALRFKFYFFCRFSLQSDSNVQTRCEEQACWEERKLLVIFKPKHLVVLNQQGKEFVLGLLKNATLCFFKQSISFRIHPVFIQMFMCPNAILGDVYTLGEYTLYWMRY